MSKTLVTDSLAENNTNKKRDNIIWGADGWTVIHDENIIRALVEVGALYLHKTVSSSLFETKVYISINGKDYS